MCYNHVKHFNGGFTMAYKISDECIACGACASACPAECIEMGSSHYEIDASQCLNCGTCADTCPMSAISPEE